MVDFGVSGKMCDMLISRDICAISRGFYPFCVEIFLSVNAPFYILIIFASCYNDLHNITNVF